MALDLLAIISAAGTGAVTGYLTNNLALKMIFKKYGPLGGVVIKTKDEFIKSISQLVERDLINHNTLETEFSRQKFKNNFSQSVDDFLNIYLEEKIKNSSLNDIPAWRENYKLLAPVVAESSCKLLEKSTENLTEQNLDLIIPESELKKILAAIYSQLLKKAEAEGSFENITAGIYEELKNKKIEQLLSNEVQLQLKYFIKEIINYFEGNYQNLEAKNKKEFKAKIKELFSLQSLSRSLIREVKELRLSDLFKNADDLKKLKQEEILSATLKDIFLNFKIKINNSDLKIDDLLDEKLEAALINELEILIKNSQKEFLNFLKTEKDELNSLILEAVEAEIEASTGLKAVSRQGIYSKYQEKIDEYGMPLTHLKNYLNQKINSESQQLAETALSKIKDFKIKRLFANIEFKEEARELEDMIWRGYQKNKDKRIIDLFSKDIFQQQKIEDKLIDILFSLIKEISSNQKSAEMLFDYLASFEVQDLINKESLISKSSENSEKICSYFLQNDFITAELSKYLNDNFFALINSELKINKDNVSSSLENYLKKAKAKFSNKELKEAYQLLKGEGTVPKLTDSIMTFFYNHLPALIDGRVAEAASENLYKLSDEEVQQAIEDFMGKELKPITYLGAFLGAAVALIFSLSGAESFILNSSPSWLNYLSSALLYGGVGWLTNVLAIWMIFHPYQEKKIADVKLPFTPGVVAKNRSRFADSMGKFVEKELLKADSAAEIIEKNREEIKQIILQYFEKNDYQQLFEIIKENSHLLAVEAVSKVDKLISEFDFDDLDKLLPLINSRTNKYLAKKITKLKAADQIQFFLENNDLNLKQLQTQLFSKFDLKKITSVAAGNYSFNFDSGTFKKLLQNKELYPFLKFIIPELLNEEIYSDFKRKALNNLKNNSDHYLDKGLELLYQNQAKIAQLVNFKKDEIIEAEKNKKGGLLKNTLISGAVYMADLDEFFNSVTARVFTRLKEDYLTKKRGKLENILLKSIVSLNDSEFLNNDKNNAVELLNNFFVSDKTSDLITEVLYLSEDKLNKLLAEIIKTKNENLFTLKLEIKADQIEYFIDQHLKLEEKLKLLLRLKNLFTADLITGEIKEILNQVELNEVKNELKRVINSSNLISSELIEAELLNKIKKNTAELIKNSDLNDLLLTSFEDDITAAVVFLEEEMDKDSLKYLLELLIESGVDSFKNNSEALLKSLELKELTAEEVRKMNPAEIEEIFDSFAGKYFTHLKHYGWFGGVFGVLQLLLRNLF